jgi:hypothetical protein
MAKETLQEVMEGELFPQGGTEGELISTLKFMENHAYALSPHQIAAYAMMERLDMRDGGKNPLYKPFRNAFDEHRKYLGATGVFMDIITKKFESEKAPREAQPHKPGLFGFGR